MQPLSNKHVDLMDGDMTCPGEKFKSVFTEQISNARCSVLNEMCEAAGVTEYSHLRSPTLNTRSITKEKMSVWLETLVCILDSYCTPVLTTAAELPTVIDELKDEKIADQKTIKLNFRASLSRRKV